MPLFGLYEALEEPIRCHSRHTQRSFAWLREVWHRKSLGERQGGKGKVDGGISSGIRREGSMWA